MAKIRIKNLFKFYDAIEALNDVNIEINEGEFFVLLGPSGAGKSTFLKVIAGVEDIDVGEIYFGDNLMNSVPAFKRNIAITFETYALYAHLTVYENIAFPLKAPVRRKDYTPEKVDQLVRKWADFLQIGELLERLPQQLSGGQRQRVAMGRMLVREPEVFLMDEPIAHLDAKLRHLMRAELKNVQRDLGITTIYATPDQLEALSMGDRIAVMDKGSILQTGIPNDVFNKPVDEMVASFVSDVPMNIIPCRLQKEGDRYMAVNSHLYVNLPQEYGRQLEDLLEEPELDLGIRPHRVQLSTEKKAEDSIQVEISSIETSGNSSIISIFLGDIEVFVKILTSEFIEGLNQAWLDFPKDSLYFFNRKTKKRYDIANGHTQESE